MTNESVLYHQQKNVGIITLNRPHRLNAINLDLLKGFMEQLDRARTDTNARVVILTGEGKAFCAGEDLKDTASGKSLEQWMDEAERLQQVQRMTMKIGKPIIAAIPGYALGGGCEFAMGCDIRIASETAVFGFPETTVGMTVTNAGTKLLPPSCGVGKGQGARTDRAISLMPMKPKKSALSTRWLHLKISWPNQWAMAEKIASRSPLATSLSRTAIDQGMESSFDQVMELEKSHLLICAQSGTEFVEKRLKEMNKP